MVDDVADIFRQLYGGAAPPSLSEQLDYERRGQEGSPGRPEMNKGQGPTHQNLLNARWETQRRMQGHWNPIR